MKQNTLHWDHEAYTPRRSACSHNFKRVSSILWYYEVNTLLWDREAYTPRRGAYPHYYEPIIGGREIQPLYLSPIRCFKRKVFNQKSCVISSHIALHFIYVLTLSEISKNSSSDRSKVFLDLSKCSTNSFRSFWMTQSTLNSYSIDRKVNLIDRREFLIG